MCGIFCYLGQFLTESQLRLLSELIKHRGPDDHVKPKQIGSGCAVGNNNLYFGFHRLAINGLDNLSNQPLSHKGIVLICNGEIYNHQELKDRYQFGIESHSDCEVIAFMYERFGIKRTLQELEGVFAFCLYDTDNQKLIVARDPIGIRPLFYGVASNGGFELLFASEAKSITGAGKVTPSGFSAQQFPIGNYMEVTLSGRKFTNYYSVTSCLPLVPWHEDGYSKVLAKVRSLVERAVKIRAHNSDRPVGVFLSGGLDSSLVAALAKREITNLHSFAIGLPNAPDFAPARQAAQAIGTIHKEITFTVEEAMVILPELIYHLETPDITTIRAAMGMFLLSRYLKNNTDITVVLSGEGPDEVFSGYLYNHNAPSPEELHKEAVWRIQELHKFDVLRCDRSTAAHSLEVRVPLLCKNIVRYALSLDPRYRDPKTNNGIEKNLLREAARGLLPEEIRTRPKEAFSDGVGYNWVDGIKAYAEHTVNQEDWQHREELYPQLTPKTKEGFMYRSIYEKFYGRDKDQSPLVDYIWMPKWSDETDDPSATTLKIHASKIDR